MCHLEAVAVNPHHAVKELSIQVRQTIVGLPKQNRSNREIAGTLGVAKSTVWYILGRKECASELSNIKRSGRPQRTTEEDGRRNPLHGKEKTLHNIQLREEHSPGGSCVTVKVYN